MHAMSCLSILLIIPSDQDTPDVARQILKSKRERTQQIGNRSWEAPQQFQDLFLLNVCHKRRWGNGSRTWAHPRRHTQDTRLLHAMLCYSTPRYSATSCSANKTGAIICSIVRGLQVSCQLQEAMHKNDRVSYNICLLSWSARLHYSKDCNTNIYKACSTMHGVCVIFSYGTMLHEQHNAAVVSVFRGRQQGCDSMLQMVMKQR